MKVPRMEDNSDAEKEYERSYTLRGYFYNDDYIFLIIIYILSVVLATLPSLPVIITGIWALVQCMMFFPITTQASISVIIISVLVIIMGVLMIAAVVGFVLTVQYERATSSYRCGLSQDKCFTLKITMPITILLVIDGFLLSLGIAAGSLIPSLSESIGTSANISIITVHDSQGASDAWDAAQNTLECCGAANFSDYEHVFNNFSVPVSCCNTTNPLANETTCPDIVMDTNVTTELIYTEGCVPQFVSYFHYIHSVVAGVSIMAGAIPIVLGLYVISLFAFRLISQPEVEIMKFFPTFVGIILIFGVTYITVAVWALVQDVLYYYPITAPANTNVMIISVLLIIAGGLMIGVGICQIVMTRKLYQNKDSGLYYCGELLFIILCVLPLIILALVVGSVAAGMSGSTNLELSSTLHQYLDDQTVQDTWNDLQENMECCGVDHFTDYERVFSNYSVPVSCCNTTNPLASECPDIVRNSQQMINQTGLIYSEGCGSHLESFFNNMFTVIAAVTITIASLQLAAVLMVWWWCSIACCKMWKHD